MDYSELKQKALVAVPLTDSNSFSIQQYYAAASPDVVLNLLAEVERLKQKMIDGVTIQQYVDIDNEIDNLRAKNQALLEALKDLDNARVSLPSCQAGLVTRCICITCSIKRTRAAIKLAEGQEV